MKLTLIIFVIFISISFVVSSNLQQWDTTEISGYHFHTYFFQNNDESERQAFALRESIGDLSDTFLAGCRLNRINYAPIGPHIVGSYETCCNASAIIRAQSFFMQNHGNLSILLHPLTRYEVLDHTTRAMWLGKDMPLDISTLSEDRGEGNADQCLPIDLIQAGGGGATFVVPNWHSIIFVIVLYFVVNYKII